MSRKLEPLVELAKNLIDKYAYYITHVKKMIEENNKESAHIVLGLTPGISEEYEKRLKDIPDLYDSKQCYKRWLYGYCV